MTLTTEQMESLIDSQIAELKSQIENLADMRERLEDIYDAVARLVEAQK